MAFIRLTDEQYTAFLESLASEDRQEFFYRFRGSERLMRFVACYDLLILGGSADGARGTLQDAYVMATGCDYDEAKRAAYQAAHHPAVEALTQRLRFRSRVEDWAKIEGKYSSLIDKILDSALKHNATFRDKMLAVKAGAAFMARVSSSEASERASKTRLGVERGRAALQAAGEINDEKVIRWVRELKKVYGDKFGRILAEASQEALPSGEPV